MLITIVVAVANENGIGFENGMPWHLPEDFAFFKSYTTGKPCIMGRKTWESLPKRPLPNRPNIVITNNPLYQPEGGAIVWTNLEAGLAAFDEEPEVIIMGGAQIYEQAMQIATDIRLTEIQLDVKADAHFPRIDLNVWKEVSRESHVSDKGIAFDFVHYQRKVSQ